MTRTGEAVHYSPRIGDHLEVVPGQPTRELAAMARKGLRLDLRTALREAIEGNTLVVRDRIGSSCRTAVSSRSPWWSSR